MKFALVNPNWTFAGSIYFGCREPHLPLELGYAGALLEQHGGKVRIIDAHLFNLSSAAMREQVMEFAPDVVVVTTAPSYLFWRCPPPELRVPWQLLHALQGIPALRLAAGPHGTVTPMAVLRKLPVDGVLLGEIEEVLPRLLWDSPERIPAIFLRTGNGGEAKPHASVMQNLPALRWPPDWIARHSHQHHRFDRPPRLPGAEIESSRGCPFDCSFCLRAGFRQAYRRRPLDTVIEELDHLVAAGAEYVYFIDETFFPHAELLAALARRPLTFGIQTRIDLWSEKQIEVLAAAGCVSIEAGVESITARGCEGLGKASVLSLAEISARLSHAKRYVPFVQANLLRVPEDDRAAISRWRETMSRAGVWANDPVPLFPFPGTREYHKRWGAPDEQAWERAHSYYLERNNILSDLQAKAPRSLEDLERAGGDYAG